MLAGDDGGNGREGLSRTEMRALTRAGALSRNQPGQPVPAPCALQTRAAEVHCSV